MKRILWLYCSLMCIGCANVEDESMDPGLLSDPAHPHWGHDHEAGDTKQRRVDCASRWQVNPTHTANQSVPFTGAGGRCLGRAQTGAVELGRRIRERFGHLMNLRIEGRGIQIYNCRTVRGGRAMSLHSEGRAIDVFIPTQSGRADNDQGDVIANWLVENAERIGVMAIIWDRTRWRSESNAARCYEGTHPHHDHIHIELSWAAARQETPFFREDDPEHMLSEEPRTPPQDWAPEAPTPAPPPRGRAPESNPPVPMPPSEPERAMAWLGSPCLNGAQCTFDVAGAQPICLVNQASGSNVGVCTISCEGFCPDHRGAATTFCVDASDFGFVGGFCLAQPDVENGHCEDWPGLDVQAVRRHVGSSRAPEQRSEACLPDWFRASSPDTSEGSNLDDHTTSVGVCSDRSLENTDHNFPCQGVPENTWRCGCSLRYETPVSQVCRGGRWVNYELDPQDCSRCDGRYTRGCEP